MKRNYKNLIFVLASLFTFCFVSCSSDDEPNIEDNSSDLIVSEDNVRVLVGETTTIEITEGNGEYKAFSLNEEIAQVEVNNNKLNINTYSNGKTSIVVSDKNSNYKNIEIVSYYGEIILEENTIAMKMRIGNFATKKIKVLGGNGGYVATSEDEDIASVNVDGDNVIITGKTEGTVNIHIIDQLDVETEFSVVIETTDRAYEDDELEEIKDNNSLRFYFDGRLDTTSTIVNSKEGNYNVYGWDYYGYEYEYQKIYFEGEKSVGKKDNAVFSQVDWFNSPVHTRQPVDLEIIKVDDGKIWGVFSFIKNKKLFYGHFVRPL